LEEKIIKNSKETVKQFYPETIASQHSQIFKNLLDDR